MTMPAVEPKKLDNRIAGRWIEAVWEGHDDDPYQVSDITIEISPDISVHGHSYKLINGNRLKEMGTFKSKEAGCLSEGNSLWYHYEGHERRGRTKERSGIGLYKFHRLRNGVWTFNGSFFAHQVRFRMDVQARQLNADEIKQLDESDGRAIELFHTILQEVRDTDAEGNTRIYGKLLSNPRMKKYVPAELEELRSNIRQNPLATAFLLRRILEKLIDVTFDKKKIPNKDRKLNDKIRQAEDRGMLTEKTARQLNKIKFSLDQAVHNWRVNGDIESINEYLPVLSVVYQELLGTIPDDH